MKLCVSSIGCIRAIFVIRHHAMLFLIFIFFSTFVNQTTAKGTCLGILGVEEDIEGWFFSEMALKQAKVLVEGLAGASEDGKEIGQIAGGMIGMITEFVTFCKNTKIDHDEETFRETTFKILNETIDLVHDFEHSMDLNFAKMKKAIISINETAGKLSKAVDKFILTNAQITYDEFLRDVRRLSVRFKKWMEAKRESQSASIDFETKLFKAACTNMDTSPTNIQMRLQHIVSDSQGVFNLAMRYFNYTDQYFRQYFDEIRSILDIIVLARGTYETMDDTVLSLDALHRLRNSILETNEEIFNAIIKLNEHRENEYFNNITFVYSGVYPLLAMRGYDHYLNMNYVFFETKNNRLWKKYSYSLEFHNGIADWGEPRWNITYDKNFVTILELQPWEELSLWKQHMQNLIKTVDLNDWQATEFYKFCLYEKIIVMVLGEKLDDVKYEGIEAARLTKPYDEYKSNHSLTEEELYDKIREIFLDGFPKENNYARDVFNARKSYDPQHQRMSNITKPNCATLNNIMEILGNLTRTYVHEKALNFSTEVQYNVTEKELTSANISDLYDDIKKKLRHYFTEQISLFINSSIPRIKEKKDELELIRVMKSVIIEKKKPLYTNNEILQAMKNQPEECYGKNKDRAARALQLEIDKLTTGKKPYIIRSRVNSRVEDYMKDQEYNEMKSMLGNKGTHCVRDYIIIARYEANTYGFRAFDMSGMGDCRYVIVNKRQNGYCFIKKPYGQNCPKETKAIWPKLP